MFKTTKIVFYKFYRFYRIQFGKTQTKRVSLKGYDQVLTILAGIKGNGACNVMGSRRNLVIYWNMREHCYHEEFFEVLLCNLSCCLRP